MKYVFLLVFLFSVNGLCLEERFYAGNATMSVSASILLVSTQIMPANVKRRGLVIYNNSANSVYIAFDTTCNSGNHMTIIIPTFQSWVMPLPIYQGAISAIRNAGSGTLLITEMW